MRKYGDIGTTACVWPDGKAAIHIDLPSGHEFSISADSAKRLARELVRCAEEAERMAAEGKPS